MSEGGCGRTLTASRRIADVATAQPVAQLDYVYRNRIGPKVRTEDDTWQK